MDRGSKNQDQASTPLSHHDPLFFTSGVTLRLRSGTMKVVIRKHHLGQRPWQRVLYPLSFIA